MIKTYVPFILISCLHLMCIGCTETISVSHASTLSERDNSGIVTIPIDVDRSLITWKGTKMWGRGKHEGNARLKEGFLTYINGQRIRGQFIADMKTIAITDIPDHEPVPRKNLRNHLKSEDFFHVEKYPTATFELTRTKVLENKKIRVWGNLSIRDITKAIVLTVSQKPTNTLEMEYHTTFSIDRFAYNISYQGSYWDRIMSVLDNNLVDDEIWLSIILVTKIVDE